jgi:hypothetical protein
MDISDSAVTYCIVLQGEGDDAEELLVRPEWMNRPEEKMTEDEVKQLREWEKREQVHFLSLHFLSQLSKILPESRNFHC